MATVLNEYRGLNLLAQAGIDQRVQPGRELRGRCMGVFGLGRMGSSVANLALAFGMKVVSTSNAYSSSVTKVSRPELTHLSDVIGIFVPKSEGVVLTRKDFLNLKKDVIIVNPSGHENLDLKALAEFLKAHPRATYVHLAMPEGTFYDALSRLKNARLYPLFASITEESKLRRREFTLRNLIQIINKEEPEDRVI